MRNSMPYTLTLAILAVLLLASPAFAAVKPPELEGIVRSSQPYGRGTLTRLLFHVYDAEIWTDAPHWSYRAPFALCITYAMSFDARELSESTLQQASRMSSLTQEEKDHFAGYLGKAYRNVRGGDRICALYTPPDKTAFFVNAQETARIKDAEFASTFFGIWLSDRTSEPSLRAKLLGIKL